MNGHTFVGDELEREEAQSYIDLIYEVADGFVSIAVMQDKQWKGFTEAVSRPDLLKDPRFATPDLREVNRDARLEAIQEAVKNFAIAELVKLLDTHRAFPMHRSYRTRKCANTHRLRPTVLLLKPYTLLLACYVKPDIHRNFPRRPHQYAAPPPP